MTVTVNHSTPADGTFSATGATAWDADHTISGVLPVANGGTNTTTSTGTGNVVLSDSPTFTTAITSTGALQLTGSDTVNQNIATAQTTGTLSIGGASGSGAITLGPSTSGQTVNIATGVNTVAAKIVNIGTGGTFTTTISMGNGSGLSNLTLGQSTGIQNINIGNGATLNTITKNITIGDNGAVGSQTNINVGNAARPLTCFINLNGITTFGTSIGQVPIAVASLPSGVDAVSGDRYIVNNALNPRAGSTVVGGGAVVMPVYYNGTNWICDAGLGATTGSGSVVLSDSPTFTTKITTPAVTASTDDLTLSAISTGAVKFNTLGGLQAQVSNVASAVNYLQFTGSPTTKAPIVSMQGSDTNISMAFQPKGTGAIDLAAGSSGVNISNGGTVTAITRTAGGTGYGTAPTVTISPPTTTGGVQATATCTVTAGVVDTVFTITNAGSGYIEQPTITFSGGGGSGAAAYATVGSGTVFKTLGNNINFNTPNSQVLSIVDKNSSGNYPTNTNPAFTMVPSQNGFGASYLGMLTAGYFATNSTSSNAFIFATGITAPLNGNGGSSQFQVSHTASAVNYAQVTGAVTGTATIPRAPILSAQGSDANISLALFPKGTGIVYTNQNAPVAYDATNTLLIADILSQVITTTSAVAVSLTFPTGTLTDAGILAGNAAVNTAFEWSIINLGSAVGVITLIAGTGHTIVGSLTIAVGASARFKTRKTATNTYVTYRLA
jgi:hypothetical protein